jgi:formamidopyrimidine-DNA glycosylase
MTISLRNQGNTVGKPCSVCRTFIKKEAYLGGSIYICDGCQPQS